MAKCARNMYTFQRIFLITIWLLVNLSKASSSFVNHGNMKTMNWDTPLTGYRLNATPILTRIVPNCMLCLGDCGKISDCMAVNFGPRLIEGHACELLSTTQYDWLSVNLTAQPLWSYVSYKTNCGTLQCPSDQRCVTTDENNDGLCLDLSKVKSCLDYRNLGFTKNGIYTLTLGETGRNYRVYCDQEDWGGGWTLMMRNDAQDELLFNKRWAEYRDGFGDLNGMFWWGNELLHHITKNTLHELKVDLKKTSNTAYVHYTGFRISDETDGYRLSFSAQSYSGNGGTALNYNNGMKFSTFDRDNDLAAVSCSRERNNAGWWYKHCTYCVPTHKFIHWGSWDPDFIEIKIRPMT